MRCIGKARQSKWGTFGILAARAEPCNPIAFPKSAYVSTVCDTVCVDRTAGWISVAMALFVLSLQMIRQWFESCLTWRLRERI